MERKGDTLSAPSRDRGQGDAAPYRPRPGMRLGRYELLTPIARGGMAEVWIGRQLGDLGFSRLVALKTILPELADDASFRKMFLDEARIAARIRHTNVVEVLDLGEEGPTVYQVMALVEGESVAGLLKRMPRLRSSQGSAGLPAAIAVRIVADAAAGLHAAHELVDEDGTRLLLVHRDVSPQNILVGIDGVAKLSDFGVAKVLGRHADETVGGQVKGKFAYLSPEQAARRQLDRRTDVFSAGIVLWEALTGSRLFRGADDLETLANVASMTIPDPRSIAPTLPAPIADVTMRALRRDRSERYATAAELAEALEAAAQRAGAVASKNDVAALVAELVGKDVERRRTAARAASRGAFAQSDAIAATSPSDESVATTLAATSRKTVRPPRSRAVWIAASSALVAAVAVGAVAVRVGARRVGVPVAGASGTTSVDLAVSPPAMPTEATAASAIAPGAPPAADSGRRSATTDASPSPSAPSKPRARATPAPARMPPSRHSADPEPELRPKFASPYE